MKRCNSTILSAQRVRCIIGIVEVNVIETLGYSLINVLFGNEIAVQICTKMIISMLNTR